MRKKLLTLFLAVCATMCLCFGLSACGKEHTHSYTSEVTTAATCTTAGVMTYTCSCGDSYTEAIPATGHTPAEAVKENEIKATCTEGGSYESVIYCSVCGNEISRETKTISALGHTEVTDEAVTPTCTKTGLTGGSHCSVCNIVMKAQEVIPTTGHTPAEAVKENEKAASCTENGSYESVIYCSVCKAEISRETKTIEAAGHNYVDGYCTVCGIHEPSEGLAYTLSDDETFYIVSGIGTCTDTDIVIPSTYNGLPVTSIGDYAFYYCTSLTNIVIPDSVTSIDRGTFEGCTSLTSIVIPDSVTSIGWDAFRYCTSLTGITVNENNNNYKSIDGNLYSKDGATLIQYAIGKTDASFTIPDSVTEIGERAFYGCTSIESIVLPGSVTAIGDSAFYGCSSLTSIVIPDSVTSIGDYAFEGCTSLTSIVIPDSVTSIGEDAFIYCDSLTSVTIGNGVTEIGESAFYDCTSLTNVTIGNGVTSIGYMTFGYCISLTSVTIGNSVTSIGLYAFWACESLTSIVIPDSVTEIGYSAFSGCDSLTSVVIPDSVTSIGLYAFSGCSSLESVTIGNGVTTIRDGAFENCSSLTSITVDGNNSYYKSIDGNLYNKDGTILIQYAIGKTDASFTIPDGVTEIGYEAFSSCRSLTSIVIPDSVTEIGYWAFAWCFSLTSVTFQNTSGWWVSDDSDTTSISSEDLTDQATAAKYLAGTYSWYYWKRS